MLFSGESFVDIVNAMIPGWDHRTEVVAKCTNYLMLGRREMERVSDQRLRKQQHAHIPLLLHPLACTALDAPCVHINSALNHISDYDSSEEHKEVKAVIDPLVSSQACPNMVTRDSEGLISTSRFPNTCVVVN